MVPLLTMIGQDMGRMTKGALGALLAASVVAGANGAWAAARPVADSLRIEVVADIQRAIEEQRLVDASLLLDRALLSGSEDPRLNLMSGELSLARHQPEDALAQFRIAKGAPATRARALQGEGVALAVMGRTNDSLPVLREAVAADPKAWRAWNALGKAYDGQRDWSAAETAYGEALAAAPQQAAVLNNRGYSRLLQNRVDEAVTDLVAALKAQPNLAIARTNLRFAMALRGDYDRAVAGGQRDERAINLNNAGLAAALRGDYDRARDLLNQAMQTKGEYYARASANLDLVRDLAGHTELSDARR